MVTEFVDLARLAKDLQVTPPVLARWLESQGVTVLRISRQRWRAERRAVDKALGVEQPPEVTRAELAAVPVPDDAPVLPAGFTLLSPVRKRKQA